MFKSAYKNSNLFLSVRKLRAHDCMDARDRATQEAKAENRGVYIIHEEILLCEYSSTELTQLPFLIANERHIESRKPTVGAFRRSAFLEVSLNEYL